MSTVLKESQEAAIKFDVFRCLRDRTPPPSKMLFFMSRQTDDLVILHYAIRKENELVSPYIESKMGYASTPDFSPLSDRWAKFFGLKLDREEKQTNISLVSFPDRALRLRLKKQGNVTATMKIKAQIQSEDGKTVVVEIDDAEVYNVHMMEKMGAISVDVSEIRIFARVVKSQLMQALKRDHKNIADITTSHGDNLSSDSFVNVVEVFPVTAEIRSKFKADDIFFSLFRKDKTA